MKHFRISILSGRTGFSAECSTVAEAWDILQDALSLSPALRARENPDDLIARLVDMKRGELVRREDNLLVIEYLDGEV